MQISEIFSKKNLLLAVRIMLWLIPSSGALANSACVHEATAHGSAYHVKVGSGSAIGLPFQGKVTGTSLSVPGTDCIEIAEPGYYKVAYSINVQEPGQPVALEFSPIIGAPFCIPESKLTKGGLDNRPISTTVFFHATSPGSVRIINASSSRVLHVHDSCQNQKNSYPKTTYLKVKRLALN